MYCGHDTTSIIINNTISKNYAYWEGYGICIEHASPYLSSNIVWGDLGEEIYCYSSSYPVFNYNNIQDYIPPGDSNISIDPLFRDPDNGDFHLMATYCGDPFDSPCIDIGHPGILDTILNCNWGLGDERSDMGAYSGGEEAVNIDEPNISVPQVISLSQNYPNPFNATTTIKYDLPYQSHVTIEIYDVLGRKAASLIDRQLAAGYHKAIWQADGFSSGMYFYKITAGEYNQTEKMVLLK